jgi:hypothetical protein
MPDLSQNHRDVEIPIMPDFSGLNQKLSWHRKCLLVQDNQVSWNYTSDEQLQSSSDQIHVLNNRWEKFWNFQHPLKMINPLNSIFSSCQLFKS